MRALTNRRLLQSINPNQEEQIVCKKTTYYCLAFTLAALLLRVPCYAGVQTDRSPIAHSWPTLSSPLQVYTYDDPNSPTGESGPDQKIGENFNQGRGLMQTFMIPIDGNGGFTLDHIVITGNGPGNPTNTYSLHLFDLNTAGPDAKGPDSSSYIPAYDALPLRYDWFSSSCFFIYPEDANTPPQDNFVEFTFSDYDKVQLEPNHLYAFEIWGPVEGENFNFMWIRDVADPYAGGRGYECPSSRDDGQGPGPSNLGNYRSHLSGESRDCVMAVYGVPFDGNAYAPQPRDYETNVTVNPTLTWKPGQWSDDTLGHQVWFSSNFNAVARRLSSANKGRRTEPSYTPPGPLALNTTYYWRVDEYNDTPTVPVPSHPDGNSYWGVDSEAGVEKPTIWRFTTLTPQAHGPVPTSDSTTELKIKALEIRWTPGALAADTDGHRVYFGTDYTEVSDATTSTFPIYRGARSESNYPLVNLAPDYMLESDKTYYWRIDEVNDATPGSPWKGDTWNFRTPDPLYIVIESFDYGSQLEMNELWQSGYISACLPDYNNGGSISLNAGVMRFAYDNRGIVYYPWSEAKLDYKGVGADWTIGGLVNLKSISISMDGNMFNAIDPEYDRMYVAIEDIAGNVGLVLNDDPNAQAGQLGLREWNVPLDDLIDGIPGIVDLADINALYIGLGSRCSWGSRPYGPYGSTGVVTFDNIRLYVPRCFSEYVATDFSGDCITDLEDLYKMANDWLVSDYYTVDGNEVIYHPLFSPANLDDREPEGFKTVNFYDYTDWVQHYIEEQLWPCDGCVQDQTITNLIADFTGSDPNAADAAYIHLFNYGIKAIGPLLDITEQRSYAGSAYINPHSSVAPIEQPPVALVAIYLVEGILWGNPTPHYTTEILSAEPLDSQTILYQASAYYRAWWDENRGLSLEELRTRPFPLYNSPFTWFGPLIPCKACEGSGTKVDDSKTPFRIPLELAGPKPDGPDAGNDPDPYAWPFKPEKQNGPTPYNCLAWALGHNDRWIEPNEDINHLDIISDYGYELVEVSCTVPCPEGKGPKIKFLFFETTIWGMTFQVFQHVVRQQNDGKWTSKNGSCSLWNDIDDLDKFFDKHYATWPGWRRVTKAYCKK